MAQKVNIELIDDLDGTKAVETIPFSIDGTHYEVDLNTKNAKALRTHLDKYVAVSRRTKTVPRPAARKPAKSGPKAADVRDWAQRNGIEVNAQGRVPQDVVDQYLAAQ